MRRATVIGLGFEAHDLGSDRHARYWSSALRKIGVLSLTRSRWVKIAPEQLPRHAPPGHVRLRFDRHPIRIGHSILEMPE